MDSKLSDEEVAQYWDNNAESWTEHVRNGWDVYREYYNGQDRCGCWMWGRLQHAVVGQARSENDGVNISPKLIEFARQEERRRPLGIHYEVASYSDLSLFHHNSFDVVVSFMALNGWR